MEGGFPFNNLKFLLMLIMFTIKIFAFCTTLLFFATITTSALAAEQMPPWPMLFEGTAYYDGELLAEGSITVRIDDWESRPIVVQDGSFKCADTCLLAGPPSYDYVGKPVSFHLNSSRIAQLIFPFPLQGTPSISPIDLYFGDLPLVLPTPTPFTLMLVPTPTPLPASGMTPTPTTESLPVSANPTPTPATTTDSANTAFYNSFFFYIVIAGVFVILLLTVYGIIRFRSTT